MNINMRAIMTVILISTLSLVGMARVVVAASAEEIDTKVDGSLAEFKKEVPGGAEFLNKAKGVLVFPEVTKAGLVVGGEYGTGALRIGGKSVQYYNIASASFGLQIGAQQYSIVMAFLND
jgi:lipid-binding SYLF domain-containing protein